MITFNERLNLFKFNYETYKLAYNNNRHDLCKKLFNDEMLYFLNNTSYELIDSFLSRIILFENLKLSRKTLYKSFIGISAKPLLNYLYNIKEIKLLKKSKSMPELISSNNYDNNSVLSDNISDINSISSNNLSKDSIYSNDINESSEIILPKTNKKGILYSLFGI